MARYLAVSRGVKCCAEQIILTSGHQQSLNIVADLLPCKEWTFAIENPGYDTARRLMGQKGYKIIPIPLEYDGISTSAVNPHRHALL